MKQSYRFLVIVCSMMVLVIMSSCVKPEVFPPEPEITYDSYEIMGDSLLLSVKFTDGDGDIGLNQSDTTGDFAQNSFYHYNYYIEYYEKMDGNWVKGTNDLSGNNFPTGDTINFRYRIKNLTPIGQNKALKGTINIYLAPTFYNPISNHNDTIMYAVTLIDRALNKSNRILTPEIVR